MNMNSSQVLTPIERIVWLVEAIRSMLIALAIAIWKFS